MAESQPITKVTYVDPKGLARITIVIESDTIPEAIREGFASDVLDHLPKWITAYVAQSDTDRRDVLKGIERLLGSNPERLDLEIRAAILDITARRIREADQRRYQRDLDAFGKEGADELRAGIEAEGTVEERASESLLSILRALVSGEEYDLLESESEPESEPESD